MPQLWTHFDMLLLFEIRYVYDENIPPQKKLEKLHFTSVHLSAIFVSCFFLQGVCHEAKTSVMTVEFEHVDGLIYHTCIFGFLAGKYCRIFPNAKVIVKGCIPMHTQCAYGTCWPAFEHLATWIVWRLSCSCNGQS